MDRVSMGWDEELGGGLGKALLADYLYKVLQLLDLHTYPSISLHLFHKNGGNSAFPLGQRCHVPILPESAKIFQEKKTAKGGNGFLKKLYKTMRWEI